VSMGYYPQGGEPSKLISGPGTHIRYIVTEASQYLRRRDLSKAFQGYNHAIEIFKHENRISSTSDVGKETRALFDTWEYWYNGPIEEPTIWVGPPGAELGPAYWDRHRISLTRIGTVWTDPEASQTAYRNKNAPPLRYVAGAAPWTCLEGMSLPVSSVPMRFFAGIEAQIAICYDMVDEGGQLVSRALNCRGNCLECPKCLLTNKTLILNRLEEGEYRRLAMKTQYTLVKLAAQFEHTVSRFYGVGGGEESFDFFDEPGLDMTEEGEGFDTAPTATYQDQEEGGEEGYGENEGYEEY